MRAVRCHELIGPEGLRVDEVPEPAPGPGEILIDVKAAGVNFPDLLITHGKYQFKPPPPFVPGGEVAGVVRAVGAGVKAFAVGDRVAATMLFGAFAEQVAVQEAAAAKLPDSVSFEVGASVLLTYATTMHALVDRAALREGETLLVLGASGGVGTSALEIGKCLGAKVIAAASSPSKLAYCRDHGADEIIDYSHEDLKDRAKALSGGGVDVVYDPVGGDYTEQALRAVAWEGRYLIVGFASGPIPRIPANLILLKSCQVVGVFWGAFAQREPARNAGNVNRVLAWMSEGKVRPHIDAVLPFSRAQEALSLLAQRAVKGKLVLVPG
ncbi:MAG: NADPH:quinone oxidoreductase family protein [Polyangiaceae bacterium]